MFLAGCEVIATTFLIFVYVMPTFEDGHLFAGS